MRVKQIAMKYTTKQLASSKEEEKTQDEWTKLAQKKDVTNNQIKIIKQQIADKNGRQTGRRGWGGEKMKGKKSMSDTNHKWQ